MASDPGRRKRIQEAVTWLRGQKIEPHDSPALPFMTYAELIAYQAELARAEGYDEAENAEIVLTAISMSREDLAEAEAVLRPLGYKAISSVLKRLARRAPSRPRTSWKRRQRRFNLGVLQSNQTK